MRRMSSFTAFRQTCEMFIPSFFAFTISSSSIRMAVIFSFPIDDNRVHLGRYLDVGGKACPASADDTGIFHFLNNLVRHPN